MGVADQPKPLLDSELIYVNPDGTLDDTSMHEELLAGDHSAAIQIGRDTARRLGLTEAEIAILFGDGGS